MKLGLERVFTESEACKVHHTYHDGSTRSCTLVCVFQTCSCKIVIDHRQRNLCQTRRWRKALHYFPISLQNCVDWTSTYILVHMGALFSFWMFKCKKKIEKKTFHVPANACSPCKKNLQNCIVIPALSLSSKWVPFFYIKYFNKCIKNSAEQ
jgi:hypothetical protein